MSEQESELADLPPSAKLVYKVLESEGPFTQKELVAESMLSDRTVRYAIKRLTEIGAVSEGVYIHDARQSLYRVTDGPATEGSNEVTAD